MKYPNQLPPGFEDEFVRINLSDAPPLNVSEFIGRAAASIDTTGTVHDAKEKHSPLYEKLLDHSRAPRVDTNTAMTEAIRAAHPGAAVVVSRDFHLQIFGFPGARISRMPKTELLAHQQFLPSPRRGEPGVLAMDVTFGCFTVEWAGHKLFMYVVKYAEGYMNWYQYHFVHDDESVCKNLLLASSTWANELHEEIPVYAHGFWEKDHNLWLEVQKANWDDVILDASFKKRLQDDVNGFFSSEKIYKDLSIPWKRGVIFLGPPGNGKTISLKAIIKNCQHPALYVKNFQSFAGEEYAMQLVFRYARSKAPCILVLEDLDSLINDRNRSFFLNEIDGLQGNDGLLIIGTTNHFDRLDPALSNRPSRFDRKFNFEAPTRDERVLYAKYWQHKLEDNKKIDFSDSLLDQIADWTDRFSFAYMKEAFVSTLVILAGSSDKDFVEVLKQQIDALKESIGDGEDK